MRFGRILMAGILIAQACTVETNEGLRSAGIVVDTLESGRVVVTVPDTPLWAPGEECALRERFRLGTADGDGPDVFIGPLQVVLGLRGELFILDIRGGEVFVFGPQGEHLLTFGRHGEGPGEFSYPAGIALGPDGLLWVTDRGNNRYSSFDPATGSLVRKGRRQFLAFPAMPWPGGFDRYGRLLEVSMDRDRHPIAVVLDSMFIVQDTLLLPELPERFETTLRSFAPEPYWALHPAGGILVGEGQAYRLHHIDVAGDTVTTLELLRAPVPVTGAERDSILANRKGSRVESERRDAPPYKPAHGPLFLDDQRRIWVRQAKHSMTWDVFSERGELLGQVEAPEPFVGSPSVRGDRVAVWTYGSGPFQVPTAIVYDLVCPGGSS